jgi:hypothetical protein
MDEQAAIKAMAMPRVPINLVTAKQGEILKLGHITCRVQEDGSRTGRLTFSYLVLPSPH